MIYSSASIHVWSFTLQYIMDYGLLEPSLHLSLSTHTRTNLMFQHFFWFYHIEEMHHYFLSKSATELVGTWFKYLLSCDFCKERWDESWMGTVLIMYDAEQGAPRLEWEIDPMVQVNEQSLPYWWCFLVPLPPGWLELPQSAWSALDES